MVVKATRHLHQHPLLPQPIRNLPRPYRIPHAGLLASLGKFEQTEALKPCLRLWSFHSYLSILIQLIIGVFLIMRTLALYNRNRGILMILIVAAGAVLATAIWTVSSGVKYPTQEDAVLALPGCSLPMDETSARRVAAAWAGLLGFDILIFALTLYKSAVEIRYGGSAIMRVLLRDGSIYFGIMSIATSCTLITFLAFGPYFRGIVVSLANALSSVMMSRLLFNIRDPALCCRSRFVHRSSALEFDTPVWTLRYSVTGEVDLGDEGLHTELCQERNQGNFSIGLVSQT